MRRVTNIIIRVLHQGQNGEEGGVVAGAVLKHLQLPPPPP